MENSIRLFAVVLAVLTIHTVEAGWKDRIPAGKDSLVVLFSQLLFQHF